MGASVVGLFLNHLKQQTHLFIRIGIAWALGNFILITILSILAFFNLLFVITRASFLIFFVISALCFISTIFFHMQLDPKSLKKTVVNWLVLVFFLFFFIPLIKDATHSYILEWDTTAIWFLKAKAFFYTNGIWNNLFYTSKTLFLFSNKTYPIGIPLMIAAFYRIIQFANDQVVQVYMLFFYINIVLVAYGFVVDNFKGVSVIGRVIFVLGFFALPSFIFFSHSGYADIPLGFVLSLTTILFIYFLRQNSIKGLLLHYCLLTITGGLGLTLKNESATFFAVLQICALASFFWKYIYKKLDSSQIQRPMIFGAIAFCLAILPAVLWRYFVYAQQLPFYLDHVLVGRDVFSRLKTVLFFYMDELINTSKYSLTLIPLFIVFIMLQSILVVKKRFLAILPTVLFLVQFISYTYVYLITTVPLYLQLSTSFGRLLLQLLPMLFILVVYQIPIAYKAVTEDL